MLPCFQEEEPRFIKGKDTHKSPKTFSLSNMCLREGDDLRSKLANLDRLVKGTF